MASPPAPSGRLPQPRARSRPTPTGDQADPAHGFALGASRRPKGRTAHYPAGQRHGFAIQSPKTLVAASLIPLPRLYETPNAASPYTTGYAVQFPAKNSSG